MIIDIVGWVLWGAVVAMGIGYTLTKNKKEQWVQAAMRQQGSILLIGAIVVFIFPVSKFHLLWVTVLSFYLPIQVMRMKGKRVIHVADREIAEIPKKDEVSKIDEFNKTVAKLAFPGGAKQIKAEVRILKSSVSSEMSSESIKAILLQATAHSYLFSLGDESFTTKDLMEYLQNKHKLTLEDADVFVKHFHLKDVSEEYIQQVMRS